MKHILSLSGGKDSTAMLLRILELRETEPNAYPLDEIVNADTGMEFPQMYDHLENLKQLVESKGIKWVTFQSDKPFSYWLTEHDWIGKQGDALKGYGWATPNTRWCTSELKRRYIDKYVKEIGGCITYIGIAADESHRLTRANAKQKGKKYPLVDWGWDEAKCLQYCYSKGYNWGGLYEMYNRLSCWCCPLQSLKDLSALYHHFPDLWIKLKELNNKCRNDFRRDYTLEQLEIRFDYDKEIENKNISKKDYYTGLYHKFDEAGCPRKRKDCQENTIDNVT